MAQSIVFHSGSYFIGNPILYSVTADSVGGTPVFHRIILEVSVSFGGSVRAIKMSEPVTNGQTVLIDISSALRSAFDGYEYPVNPPVEMPRVSYSMKAWDEWMTDGDIHTGQTATHNGGTCYPGAFSDRERMGTLVYRGSRKPRTSPELVCNGQVYYRSTYTGGTPIFSTRTYVIGTDDIRGVTGPSLYVLPSSTTDVYEMRFINGYGLYESICVRSLRTTDIAYNKKEYIIARQESISLSSRAVVQKQNDRETWKLSSQPLDKAWMQWFLHEFLLTECAWLKVDGQWLRVHIVPEDTVVGIDREKNGLLTVEFSVRFDMTGSPFAL